MRKPSQLKTSVGRHLGKGEVESSILSCSTINVRYAVRLKVRDEIEAENFINIYDTGTAPLYSANL
jgi:hypothetical protein